MRTWLTSRILGATALMAVCVAAAGGLGLWQLDAWRAHRDAAATDLTRRAPVPITDVFGPDDAFPADRVGQPVSLDGDWLPDSTVYISGVGHQGTGGYWVVTPVELADGAAVPVVRGWIEQASSAPAAPGGHTVLNGWLQPSEGAGLVDEDPGDDVFPELRIADLAQRVPQDLYGGYVIASEEVGEETNAGADGLEPADLTQLPEVGSFTSLRNLLYALEWWFFGGFALFVWWRFLRDETAPPALPEPLEPVDTLES